MPSPEAIDCQKEFCSVSNLDYEWTDRAAIDVSSEPNGGLYTRGDLYSHRLLRPPTW